MSIFATDTRMFSDNNYIGSIYEKKVAMPANMSVDLALTGTLQGIEVPIFILQFREDIISQFQQKQSVNNKFVLLPFGKKPATIRISGITFGLSQVYEGPKGSTAPNRFRNAVELQTAFEAKEATAIHTTYEPPSFLSDFGQSIGLSSLLSWINDAAGAVTRVLKETAALLNIVSATVGSIVGKLTGEPAPPLKATENGKERPCTFQELHSLFDLLHMGSRDAVKNKSSIELTFNGIKYECRVSKADYEVSSFGQASNLITFTMDLVCLSKTTGYSQETLVSYSPTMASGGVLGKIPKRVLQAGVATASSAIRGSGASIGKVSLGRLI